MAINDPRVEAVADVLRKALGPILVGDDAEVLAKGCLRAADATPFQRWNPSPEFARRIARLAGVPGQTAPTRRHDQAFG